MNRAQVLQEIAKNEMFDLLIIGGGATGLGAALDAASRGYTVCLLEANDFAQGTSSRSTKLVHGGVRYLAQGNIKLVKEALQERGWLMNNAAHVCNVMPFVVPTFSWMQKMYYGSGLTLYDMMAGKKSLGATKWLNKKNTISLLHGIASKNLSGGICYYDGQFDDARLAIDIARTAYRQGARMLNHCKVTGLIKKMGKLVGVDAYDAINNTEIQVYGRMVINATGVFADSIMQMDEEQHEAIVSPSQGVHIVVDADRFPCDAAMMIPKTDDGRVLFAVPWYGKIIIGTTDTPVSKIEYEPKPLDEEIDYLIAHANRYFRNAISKKDIRSSFAGLRPLVKQKGIKKTALLNRDHTIIVSKNNLVTVTGGKWTTYRKMAEDAVNNAVFAGKLPQADCITQQLHISEPGISITDSMEYDYETVLYFIQQEMACTVEDILSRRSRLLLLDAHAALSVSKQIATHMAAILEKDELWIIQQEKEFADIAQQHIIN